MARPTVNVNPPSTEAKHKAGIVLVTGADIRWGTVLIKKLLNLKLEVLGIGPSASDMEKFRLELSSEQNARFKSYQCDIEPILKTENTLWNLKTALKLDNDVSILWPEETLNSLNSADANNLSNRCERVFRLNGSFNFAKSYETGYEVKGDVKLAFGDFEFKAFGQMFLYKKNN